MANKIHIETFYPTNREEWRDWLKENHDFKQSIWLVQYRKKANIPSITWNEAVDEALCFGWIDSIKKKLNEEATIQFFSRRKPNGTWSKINKEKIQKLINNGRMAPAGLECIEKAKQNGSWTILDEVEELKIPQDLANAFEDHMGALDYFSSLSKSTRKMILQWLVLAKRPETRLKRINEVAQHAALKQKPKPFT